MPSTEAVTGEIGGSIHTKQHGEGQNIAYFPTDPVSSKQKRI